MVDAQHGAVEPNAPSIVGRWQVEDIGGGGVIDGAPPTVEFGADGKVSASANLNRIFGQYEVAGGVLRCSPLGSTRMAGPEAVMHQEQRLIDALSTPGAVRTDGPFLLVGDGATSLRLIRADEIDPIVVSIAVLYRERMMLPANAVITARISDVSLMDAPSRTLAEEVRTDVGGPPYTFELRVDPGTFDDRARLSASARIEVDGELEFISDTSCPVITGGAPTDVEIVVVRVSKPS